MRIIYLFIVIFLTTFSVFSQSQRIWNYHLSSNRTFDVVDGKTRVYFISERGIYYFNKEDNSINTLTKLDGLSGSDFSGMDYSRATDQLVIFYKNSMIDVVNQDDQVYPIRAIERKNLSGNKTIYNATCYEEYCYLSCGFGIVVLDLIKLEIKDSFIIGDNGNYQPVYDVAINNEHIYAGTDKGVKRAPRATSNLLDFRNWNYVDNRYLKEYNYDYVLNGLGRIWVVHQSDQWHGDKIISRHDEGVWYNIYGEFKVVSNLKINGDKIAITGHDENSEALIKVEQFRVSDLYEIRDYANLMDRMKIDPRAAIIDNEGSVWIADYNYGGIRLKDGQFVKMTPAGPKSNDIFDITYSNNKLWLAPGGRDSGWDGIYKKASIEGFSNGSWECFDSYSHPELAVVSDVVQVLPNPGDPNHIFVATWGRGILEFDHGEYITTYNEENSPLKKINGLDNTIRIGGMDFDDKLNLWVTNSEVENVLLKRKPDNNWEEYRLEEIAFSYKIGKVLHTSQGQIWIIVPRGKTKGLYVMSADGKQKKHLNVTSYFSNGDDELFVDMNNVNDIAEGNDGEIWVATTKGIAVYLYPENVFEDDPFYAMQPGIDKNDKVYHPLLASQNVTSIAVDGGNRKWCGTRSSGLFLISEDGTDELQHLTSENSNLISDNILSLAYDGDNAYLYVGTELGLLSFHTESRKAFEQFSDVYAYPNPVRRSSTGGHQAYEGNIFISGMMEDTNVKITTVSGRLVYETQSLGGQAVWDGRDLAGNEVHTGVYLVFCAANNGQETAVTKILYMR